MTHFPEVKIVLQYDEEEREVLRFDLQDVKITEENVREFVDKIVGITTRIFNLNRSQGQTFRSLVNRFVDNDVIPTLPSGGYQIKLFTVMNRHGKIWVSTTTGLHDDAGTMAEHLCRTKRFVKIGKRGGAEAMDDEMKFVGGRMAMITSYH